MTIDMIPFFSQAATREVSRFDPGDDPQLTQFSLSVLGCGASSHGTFFQ